MEPGEILSTAAQIAVALAGFAGVVVVFRRESVRHGSSDGWQQVTNWCFTPYGDTE
jgi:hypothetical protein